MVSSLVDIFSPHALIGCSLLFRSSIGWFVDVLFVNWSARCCLVCWLAGPLSFRSSIGWIVAASFVNWLVGCCFARSLFFVSFVNGLIRWCVYRTLVGALLPRVYWFVFFCLVRWSIDVISIFYSFLCACLSNVVTARQISGLFELMVGSLLSRSFIGWVIAVLFVDWLARCCLVCSLVGSLLSRRLMCWIVVVSSLYIYLCARVCSGWAGKHQWALVVIGWFVSVPFADWLIRWYRSFVVAFGLWLLRTKNETSQLVIMIGWFVSV